MSSIYQDPTLYGEKLTSFAGQIWDFSCGNPTAFYSGSTPERIEITNDYFVARSVIYYHNGGQSRVYSTEIIGMALIINTTELLVRRLLTPWFVLPFAAIGFSAKLLHFGLRSLRAEWISNPLTDKVYEIWQNQELYGNLLTSAPSKCYRFTSTPLSWHLRPDGTDRRAYIATFGPDGRTLLEHQAEYQLVPFELFEFTTRRLIGGAVTLTAAVISPIGLIIKTTHLAYRANI